MTSITGVRSSLLCGLAKTAGLAALACLLLSLAATPASAQLNYVFSCYMLEGGDTAHLDRNCNFEVMWVRPGDPGPELEVRAVSCAVLAGTASCSVVVNQRELGVPSGYVLQNVATGTLSALTREEEERGCIYSSFMRPGTSALGRYPIVIGTFDAPDASVAYPFPATQPLASTPTASNPFPFLFGTDPMPAIPSTVDTPFHIVALHYFDCADRR